MFHSNKVQIYIARLLVAGAVLVAAPVCARDEAASPPRRFVRDVTTEEVKRFLDPTRMISRVAYDFQMNWLPADIEAMTHRLRPWVALSNSHTIWADVPYTDVNLPIAGGVSGLADMTVGWGFVLHEDHRKRLTTVAGGIEVLLPTGDADKGLSLDRTVISPGIAFATNPTDLFPVYLTTWYRHSVDTPEGVPDLRLLEFRLQSFRILPYGFFLAILPTITIDLTGGSDVFSLGLGLGRALNRRVSLQGGYVRYVAGEKTFNQALTVGVTWLWGKDLGR